MSQFNYYMVMVRIRRPAAEHSTETRPERLAGVIERLGSGEKRSFADCDELLRLLSDWTDGTPNMGSAAGGGKA